MFDHRCLRSIGEIWWEHKIGNTEVRRTVLGPRNMSVIEQLHSHKLRRLGYVLRMSDNRLPQRALFTEPKSSYKRPSGGQHMTWQRNMKSLTEGLSRVGNVRLVGWKPWDPSHLWLETLSDEASSRSQWRSLYISLVCPFFLESTLTTYLSFKFLPLISDVTLVISCYVAFMVTRTNISHSVHGCETEPN